MFGGPRRRRPGGLAVAIAIACLTLPTGACRWLPNEFNASPLFRQRIAPDGTLLEWDALWPILHYERTPDGGDDFRVRPLYRRVTEPEQRDFVGLEATEHQFLWPLGRVRVDSQQSMARLFPLYWRRSRTDDLGLAETDWYLFFPFVWGGTRADGAESYFGVFPIYADLPDFLAYERLTIVLWPLYVRTERWGRVGELFLWPLIGAGEGPNGYHWHRFLPFWSWTNEPDRRYRAVFWPFVQWGTENLDTPDPIDRWWIWPLLGHQWSAKVTAWSFLWPFFQSIEIAGRSFKLDVLWPFFRYEKDVNRSTPLYQWWFWPLVAHTVTDRQDAWVWFWPLIWSRLFWDPEDSERHTTVIPFFWRVQRDAEDGGRSDFVKLWPIMHADSIDTASGDRRGEWALFSPWPWREGNAYGMEEAYGWLWTLFKGRRIAPDDESTALAADLYTTRTRHGVTQTSVPFLFNYEGDAAGGTLRLLQFIPIPWAGSAASLETSR